MDSLGYNKTCNIEDFSDAELSSIIRNVFKHELRDFPPEYRNGVPDSKQWEIAMSIRSLRDFGAMQATSTVLGIGAGTEVTIFYLTNFVNRVLATDLYLEAGAWSDVAPSLMLVEPDAFAPFDFRRDKLIVQHMDGRLLQYPDASFDGIFSSGSIEHFGGPMLIANAAYEMGRVLKPGGVLALATEYRINGPPGGDGWDSETFLFSRENLEKLLIDASGLEPVDELDMKISDQTIHIKRDLDSFLSNTRRAHDWKTKIENYPNLVLVHEGYVFCSVFVTLRKTEDYAAANNDWAKPNLSTRKAVRDASRRIWIAQSVTPSIVSNTETLVMPSSHMTANELERDFAYSEVSISLNDIIGEFNELLLRWQYVKSLRLYTPKVQKLPRWVRFIYRTAFRIRRLGHAWEIQNDIYHLSARVVSGLENHLRQYAVIFDEYYGELIVALEAQSSEIKELRNELQAAENRLSESYSDESAAALEAHTSEITEIRNEVQGVEKRLSEYRSNNLDVQAAQSQEIEGLIDRLPIIEGNLSSGWKKLEDQIEDLSKILSKLDLRVKQNTSFLRRLQQSKETSANATEADGLQFTGDDLIELIKALEDEIDELRGANAIDISIQDILAERVLVEAAKYFDDRLSAKSEVYRMPNDAWYHIDFTANWNRSGLLTNALGKLGPGGIFVVITKSEFASEIAAEDLTEQLDRIMTLGPRKARVIALRKDTH